MHEQLGFIDLFRYILLAFGGVALLVGAFTIYNTFAITVAQRVRELALLRCLGATRRQALVSVLATEGIDYECLDPAQLDHIARRFEHTLRTFDERFTIHQYLCKRSGPAIATQSYDNPLLQEAIADRNADLQQRAGQLFDLQIRFAVVYTPPRPATQRSNVKRLVRGLCTVLARKLTTDVAVREDIGELDRDRSLLREKDFFLIA